MVEADRQQPVALYVLVAAVAAARADMLLQVAKRLLGRLVVCVQHLGGDLGIAQAVQQRHALGGPQHQVKRWHAALAVRPAEELAGVGVAAVEHPHERLGAGNAALAQAWAPRPSQRPGDSPWPDRYSSRLLATSRT